MVSTVKRFAPQLPLLDQIEIQLLLAQFASEMPERIGLLRRAVVARDYAWLRRLASQLHSSATVFGLCQLAEQAAVLESLLANKAGDVVLAAATEVLIDACSEPSAKFEQGL